MVELIRTESSDEVYELYKGYVASCGRKKAMTFNDFVKRRNQKVKIVELIGEINEM